MTAFLKRGSTYNRSFIAVYNTDHLTGATGVAVIVRLSKNGAAYVAGTQATVVGNGLYSVALASGNLDTLGDLAFNCTGTNIDPTDFVDQVVDFDFNVPVVIAGTNSDKTGYFITGGTAGRITGNIDGSVGSVVSGVTLSGGTYSVNLGGSVNNVVQATTTVITGGTTNANVVRWVGSSPNVLISGRVDSNSQVVGDKTDYFILGGTSGRVTGNVDGNITGSVGSVTAPVSLSKGINVTQWASGTVSTNVSGIPRVDVVFTGGTTPVLMIKKNTIYNGFTFPMIDSGDHISLKTGLTVSGSVSIDGGSFGALTNSPTEIGTTGIYTVNLSAADLNGRDIMLQFTSASADTRLIKITTQT